MYGRAPLFCCEGKVKVFWGDIQIFWEESVKYESLWGLSGRSFVVQFINDEMINDLSMKRFFNRKCFDDYLLRMGSCVIRISLKVPFR